MSGKVTLAMIQSRCVYGLEYFCDGTPNKSRLRAGIEYTKRKPCKYLNGGCPVRNNAEQIGNADFSAGAEKTVAKKALTKSVATGSKPKSAKRRVENGKRAARKEERALCKAVMKAIKEYRGKKRLTLEEFAEAAEVGVWTIKRWESGNVVPRMDSVARIEALTGVKIRK